MKLNVEILNILRDSYSMGMKGESMVLACLANYPIYIKRPAYKNQQISVELAHIRAEITSKLLYFSL